MCSIKGFTLIEMLIALSIIAIFAVMTIGNIMHKKEMNSQAPIFTVQGTITASELPERITPELLNLQTQDAREVLNDIESELRRDSGFVPHQ